MLTTRPATPADEDRVMELLAQLMEDAPVPEDILRPAFQRLLEEPSRGAALIAEDETGVLGVITFSYNFAVRYGGFYAQIEELVVDSEARGRNAGATLVQASITAARRSVFTRASTTAGSTRSRGSHTPARRCASRCRPTQSLKPTPPSRLGQRGTCFPRCAPAARC